VLCFSYLFYFSVFSDVVFPSSSNSVDYVVHLALAYVESPAESRAERTRDALTEMGVTVLGGALTSLGASFMLFFCLLQFFFKFGAFMFVTIFGSIMWSMFYFMSVCATIGPERDQGSLKPLLRKIVAACKKD
jgi:protein dispatched 1